MIARDVLAQVRRMLQDTSETRWSDAEIERLGRRECERLFGFEHALTYERQEALAIVIAFRLLQARDAAAQLESLATVQG